MTIVSHGTVKDGAVVLPEPLALPDGTKVSVSIERPDAGLTAEVTARIKEFDALDFHGMWADREDMADSVAWVRKLREQWQQRLSRRA